MFRVAMAIERGLVKTRTGYIHYRASGRGKPVVLLHINQQSSALYLELLEVLAPGARAIAIDYPSHGDSDHISFQPTVSDYAGCVIEVMDALGIARASVLGEAVGAVVSIELAAAYPQRVDKAILVNCPFYRDSAATGRSDSALKQGARPSDPSGFPTTRTIEFMLERDAVHAPMQPSQSWMDRINVAQLEVGRERWQALGALHQYDIPGNLPRVAAPVLMLTGEHFHYRKHLDELTARVQRIESAVIDGGRFCMTWERAEEIGRRTLAFLQ
jgi:pimeloyl-ACP methyl ester carboxylesterase